MGILDGIFPERMAEHMLGDIDAGNLVQMGGSGMAEQPGVERFFNAHAVCRVSENILKGPRGYPSVAFCRQERPFCTAGQFKIRRDDLADAMGQHHAADLTAFFPDPQQT